jgi:general transcription factor 3C polypeptide 3 (transcription factor C subunit 4)
MEAIRQAPHAIEPFLTLANIYEDTGQKEKLHQILLIAANLKRTDVELWIKAGELSVELNQLPMAAQCLKKAYNLDKSNIPLLWRRATIHQELQEWNKAIKCYTTLKELLPADAGCDYIEMAKDMARIYHNLNETDSAIEVFKVASDKYFDFFDNEAINIYTELLISTRQFSDTFQLMARFYKINMQKISRDPVPMRTPLMDEPLTLSSALSMSLGATEDDISQAIATFTGMSVVGGLDGDGDGPTESDLYEVNEIPEALPVDLRAKLIVSMIHLKYKFNKDILVILSSNPASYGDLMLDVAEAFMENANFSEALPLLSSLIETKEFNQAGVWLKHAECHHMLNELEAAALSYSNVLSLAPHHTETRMTLASLYSQLGMTEDALALLDAEDHLYNMMQLDEGQPCAGPDGNGTVDVDSSTRQSIDPSVGTTTTTTTTYHYYIKLAFT